MPFVMKTAPTVLPVTVEEVKAHTIISSTITDDDALLTQYIKAMTLFGQHLTGRQFVEATFQLELDTFPSGNIILLPELQSVVSVSYVDSDGVDQTLSEDAFDVKKKALRGYLRPVDQWPAYATDVVVEFNSGWPIAGEGTEGDPHVSTTPEDIKIWIMVRVAGIYEQREPFVLSKGGQMGVAEMPKSFLDHMLDCIVVPGLGAAV